MLFTLIYDMSVGVDSNPTLHWFVPNAAGTFELATIRRFIQRYPKARIGYSGHERPADHHVSATALAIGAEVFERHVGLLTDKTPLNAYSLDMPDVANWLKAMSETTRMLGSAKTATT